MFDLVPLSSSLAFSTAPVRDVFEQVLWRLLPCRVGFLAAGLLHPPGWDDVLYS